MGVRQRSKHELAQAWRAWYLKASRAGKGRPLDEFCQHHWLPPQYAVGLLRDGPPPARTGHGGRPREYSSVVVGALRVTAEASDWLCGKGLAPFLPELVPALEAEGLLVVETRVREQLIGMSAATIDRRLRPFRLQLRPPA